MKMTSVTAAVDEHDVKVPGDALSEEAEVAGGLESGVEAADDAAEGQHAHYHRLAAHALVLLVIQIGKYE